LVRKLQNLGSATSVCLLKFCRDIDELRRRLNDGLSNIQQMVIDQNYWSVTI